MLQLLKLKPGLQTTEFGLTVAGALIALLSALGVHFSDPGVATSNLALLLSMVWGAVYIAGRAVAKIQQVRAAPSAYISDAVNFVTHDDLSKALDDTVLRLQTWRGSPPPAPSPPVPVPVSATNTPGATNPAVNPNL